MQMTLEGGLVTLDHSGLVALGLSVVAGLLQAGLAPDSQLEELLTLVYSMQRCIWHMPAAAAAIRACS